MGKFVQLLDVILLAVKLETTRSERLLEITPKVTLTTGGEASESLSLSDAYLNHDIVLSYL